MSLPPNRESWPQFPGAKVLLVDDNTTNRIVAGKLLCRFGVDLDDASGGREAIEKMAQVAYELVFMDCMMPGLDGYETTRMVRRGDSATKCQSARIIAITANAMRGDRELCLQAGMDDYLAKPIHPKALLEKLRRWLEPKAGADSGVADAVEDLASLLAGNSAGALFVPAEAGESPLFDRQVLGRLFGDEPDRVSGLLDIFFEGIEENYRLLQAAMARAENLEEARLRSHTIKGSSRNFGAGRLGDLAEGVEAACVAGDWERARRRCIQLAPTITATKREACRPAMDG